MARASSETTEVPKRAPRRRVPRKTVRKVAPVSEEVVETVSAPLRRKSPTSIAAPTSARTGLSYRRFIPVGIVALTLLAAILIGYSDDGQIDIAGVIADRNERVASGQATAADVGVSGEASGLVIPVQNTETLPDAGLVASTNQDAPLPAPTEVPPTDTASTSSSTEAIDGETATTSEAVAEEEVTEETGTPDEAPVDTPSE